MKIWMEAPVSPVAAESGTKARKSRVRFISPVSSVLPVDG